MQIWSKANEKQLRSADRYTIDASAEKITTTATGSAQRRRGVYHSDHARTLHTFTQIAATVVVAVCVATAVAGIRTASIAAHSAAAAALRLRAGRSSRLIRCPVLRRGCRRSLRQSIHGAACRDGGEDTDAAH